MRILPDGGAGTADALASDAPAFDAPAPDAPAPGADVPAPGAPASDAARCRNHARVPSAGHCEACRAPICPVCRFTWAGERHFCPACATSPREHLLAARRRYLTWSLALAAWNSAALMGLFGLGEVSGPWSRTTELLFGLALVLLCVMPGAVAFALALAARSVAGPDGQSSATPAIGWNAVILGIWSVLLVIGVFLV